MRPAELERHLDRTPECSPVDRAGCRGQRKACKAPHSRVRTWSGHRQRVQLLGDVGDDGLEPKRRRGYSSESDDVVGHASASSLDRQEESPATSDPFME